MTIKLTITPLLNLRQTAVSLYQKGRRTLLADGTPHTKALAFSLGTFISLLPTPGLNFLLAGGLAALFKPLHRGALFAAIGVWNSFIVAPLYGLAYRLGTWWFAEAAAADSTTWSGQLVTFGKFFLLGNLAIAAGLTLISYLGVRMVLSLRRSGLTSK